MKRSPELEDLSREWIAWLVDGDFAAFGGLLDNTDEVLFIGTDPDEWWAGRDTILTAFRTQLEEMKGRIQVTANDVVAYADDDWGWSAMNCTFTAGGNQSPVRLSTVLKRRDGGWKMVHGHFSAGVPNEETVGIELTT